jgi:hypothetical protein
MFSILARLGLDTTGFRLGIKQAEGTANQFVRNLKGEIAGAFGTGAVIAFAKGVVQAADQIGDLREQTGLTIKEIQDFQAVAGKGGIEFTQLQSFIEKLALARREALDGKKEFQETFSALGIDNAQLMQLKNAGDLIRAVGAGIAKFNSESQGAILAQLGGIKAGPKMRGVITAIGAGNIPGERQFSESDVAELSALSDDLSSVYRQAKVFALDLKRVTSFLPSNFIGKSLLGSISGRFGLPDFMNRGGEQSQPSGGEEFSPAKIAETQAEVNRLRAVELQIADQVLRNRLETMTAEEKRAMLLKEISALELEAAEAENTAAGRISAAELRLRAERKRGELLSIQPDKQAELKTSRDNLEGNLTDLQRIGAQVSSSNETISILREQLNAQKQIARASEQTAKNTGENGGGL